MSVANEQKIIIIGGVQIANVTGISCPAPKARKNPEKKNTINPIPKPVTTTGKSLLCRPVFREVAAARYAMDNNNSGKTSKD